MVSESFVTGNDKDEFVEDQILVGSKTDQNCPKKNRGCDSH